MKKDYKTSQKNNPIFRDSRKENFESDMEEYDKRKRRKLIRASAALGLVLVGILYFNNRTSKSSSATPDSNLTPIAVVKEKPKINWNFYRDDFNDIRDPMTINLDRLFRKEHYKGGFRIGGIVQGEEYSSVLVGTEMYNVGDEVEGYKILEINSESVKIEDANGKTLEKRVGDE